MATAYYRDAKGVVISVTDGQKWRYGDNTFTGNPGDAKLAALGLTPYTPPAPPTPEEQQAAKSAALKAADNAYLKHCETLGFVTKPTVAQLDAAIALIGDGGKNVTTAVRLCLAALDVRENGGTLANVPATKHQV